MGKHQKNYTAKEASEIDKQIKSSPQVLARWLSLFDAIRIIGDKEESLGLPEGSLYGESGNDIANYINAKAPAVERFLRNQR
jgi:hypothetical protein